MIQKQINHNEGKILTLPFELQKTKIDINVSVEIPDNVVITLIATLINNI